MGLETSTYINGLVATNPTASDEKSQGDDHLRLIKSTVLSTFPNVAGAVTPTHTELNYVDGVTSAIQTQIDALVLGSYPSLVITHLSTNTTLSVNNAYSYTASGLTLTLPAAPTNGDKIIIFNMGTNIDCIIGRNGKNIMGLAENMTVTKPEVPITLIYVNSNSQADWRLA